MSRDENQKETRGGFEYESDTSSPPNWGKGSYLYSYTGFNLLTLGIGVTSSSLTFSLREKGEVYPSVLHPGFVTPSVGISSSFT